MFWDGIYKEWFGSVPTVLAAANSVTLIIMILLGVSAIVMFAKGAKNLFDAKTADDPTTSKSKHKQGIKSISYGIAFLFVPIFWPVLLSILNAAGVGQIVGGDLT